MNLFSSNSDISNDMFKKKKELGRKKNKKKKVLFSCNSDNTSNTTIKKCVEKKKNRKKRILHSNSSNNNGDLSKKSEIKNKKKKGKSILFSSNSDNSVMSKKYKNEKNTLFNSNSDNSVMSKKYKNEKNTLFNSNSDNSVMSKKCKNEKNTLFNSNSDNSVISKKYKNEKNTLFNSNSDNSVISKKYKNEKNTLFNSNSDNSVMSKKYKNEKNTLFNSNSDNSVMSKKYKNEKNTLFNSNSDNSVMSKKYKNEKNTLFNSNSDNSVMSKKYKNEKNTLFNSNSDSNSTSIINIINKNGNKIRRHKQNKYSLKKNNDKLSRINYKNKINFTKIKSSNDNYFKKNNNNINEQIIFEEKSGKIEKLNNNESDLINNVSEDSLTNKKENNKELKDFNKLQSYDGIHNNSVTNWDKHKRRNNLKTCNNKNDKNFKDIYDDEKSGMYRLINFEKFKKRAYRNLNFLSIVDITRSQSESMQREYSEQNSEDDILKLTDNSCSSVKSYQMSHNSFFSNNNKSSVNSESNNKTLDIYNYYYIDNNNSTKDNNLEKLIYNSNKYYDLYSCLFNLNENTFEESEKEEVKKKEEYNEDIKMDKEENKNYYKFSKKYKNKRTNLKKEDDKKKFSLKKNLILYRNFKNINNEISRQNNIKGLNFKEMVSNFIRIINKNILSMNQEDSKGIKKSNYYNIYDDTSEVESVLNLENNSEDKILQKVHCLCLFCEEKNKILCKGELDLTVFKYIESNKTNNTVIQPFFMDNYIFTSFLNFSIHHKNIILYKKNDNIKKLKNSQFYKYSINMKKKYKINKIIHFVAEKIELTTIAIYMHGYNFLNDKEQFVAVVNFLKWKKIKKNYFEIIKLKRNKENLKIYEKCSFLINAIDKFCTLNNIHIDDIKENNAKKKFKRNMDNKKNSYFKTDKVSDNILFSYDVYKIEQIENSLNINLKNSNLQFLFVDPLYVSLKKTFHLYPTHITILF
ncbi:conserved Plasmodium protein, unknown function [Plasmodium gallinaceum]|uniref:Uncharacterized protein n=1 Tax=Plasmodium gallinaceum TaxID=5849 RepID=A0A1J1GTX6_PLAGA|nr:conserved Plasmodium protein, unknown function [Plasmodium gallinaceum]CRG95964.1 conserved Plasmodium protein, unknown function [Plasmodium gallinaceum]